jgi:transcriptional regulator with XRE-family HTH domain
MEATAIRDLRGRLGLTRLAFADLVGVAAPTIWRWEAGRCTPHAVFAMKLDELAERAAKEQAA